LDTWTVNVNVPPGAGSDVGLADFETLIDASPPVMEIVALADAVACRPSLAAAEAETVSVCVAPALPVNVTTNEHVKLPPGPIVDPVAHVPRPARLPYTSSLRLVSRTAWPPVLVTVTLIVNVPPGAGRLVGDAALATAMDGAEPGDADVTVTVSAGSLQAVAMGVLRLSPE
jgi:hypothetical protein